MPNYYAAFFVILTVFCGGVISDESEDIHVIPWNSSPAPTNNTYLVVGRCSNGEVYDETLNSCRVNCSSSLIFSPKTRTCVDEETLELINKRDLCKNITLKENTFTVLQDGFLKVNRSDRIFSSNEYKLNGSTVTLCFPFTPRFLTCMRWELAPNEIELRDSGLTLWNRAHNLLLENGEFFFKYDIVPITCMDSSSLTDSPEMMERDRISSIYSTAWTISAVSLAISLIVYYCLHQKMKYQTKILVCHMTSLFIFYVVLIIRAWGPILTPEICIPYTFFVHYFFLSAFFWINTLAYDIWKHLPRFSTTELAPSKEKSRFIFMCAYASGCPLAIAVVALIVDTYLPVGSSFKPNFAENCWFGTLETKIIFMYGPAAMLMTSNLVFFALTVYNLRGLGNSAILVNKKIHKQLLKMYFKLMVVMGLCWTMEVVSGVVEFSSYWYAPDIINGLQGFFLFLVYVCKPSVLRDLVVLWHKNVGIGPGLCLKFNKNRNRIPGRENSSVMHERASSISILPPSEYAFGSTSTQVSTSSGTVHRN